MTKWPSAIDLFSGIGGLSLGLRQARFRVLGAVEVDPVAAETYRLNFPGVRLWQADIRNLNPREVMTGLCLKPGDLSLLAGCPPCQGFSTIRTRRGATVRDPRNRLVLEFLRFARALRPMAILMENVPFIARYRLYRELVSALRSLGYIVESRVVDAADFSVPQRRRRLLLLATRKGPPVYAEPGVAHVTVRDAIGNLPPAGSSGDYLHDVVERRSDRIAQVIASIPKDGGSRSALGFARQLGCHQRINGFTDVYGRMRWDAVSPTITGGCINPSKGRFLHPEEDRAITLREAVILQGFPSDYRLAVARGKLKAAELVGNAVPPPLVARQAGALRSRLLASATPRVQGGKAHDR